MSGPVIEPKRVRNYKNPLIKYALKLYWGNWSKRGKIGQNGYGFLLYYWFII